MSAELEARSDRRAMVLCADPLFRDAAAAHLRAHGWLVPACESDGMRAMSLLTREPIDAILIIGEVARIAAPALKGEIARRWPEIVVVTLPNGYEGDAPDVALDAGGDEVLARLGSPMSTSMTVGTTDVDPIVLRVSSLTPRERTILRALGQGATPAEIAKSLDLSPHTVRTHMANLHHKLDVHRRVELVRFAAVAGLIGGSGSNGQSGEATIEPGAQ